MHNVTNRSFIPKKSEKRGLGLRQNFENRFGCNGMVFLPMRPSGVWIDSWEFSHGFMQFLFCPVCTIPPALFALVSSMLEWDRAPLATRVVVG